MSLIAELRRRKVARAVGLYLAVGFGAVEVLTYLVENLQPGWAGVGRYALAATYLIGLPVAAYLAWAYDYSKGRLRPVPSKQEVSRASLAGFVAGLVILEAALAGLILRPGDAGDERSGPHAADMPRVIAVLPFADLSLSEENGEFLALGLHDELLTVLSRIRGLKVISRTSTARYRNSKKSLSQIGEELGAGAILEGSVQRAGGRIRVNVQLIDASSDQHVWADRYDRDISTATLFEIQGDIAVSIARAMQYALSEQDQTELARVPTDNLEAYQAYLLGKYRVIARTTAGIDTAANYFREAIRLDPDFAPAYVGLADTFILSSDYGGMSTAEMTARATPLLEKALALDDRLASAYTSMGVIRSRNADFFGAEAAFKRAIQAAPSNSTAFHWYGDVLLITRSQPEAALPLLQHALELDPLSPSVIATLGQVHEALGQFDDALMQYRKVIEIEPASPIGYLLVGHFERFVNGRLDEAVRWYHDSIARDSGNAAARASLGLCYLDLGDAGMAATWIHSALGEGHNQYWPVAAAMRLGLWERRDSEVRNMADRLGEMSPRTNDSLLGRLHLGDYRELISLYADRYPDLSCSGEARVSRENLFQAINLSLARQETGDSECATRLLYGTLDVISRMPRLGSFGFGIADVEVQVRLGRPEAALSTLRQAIDSGWRANWWLQGERSPHLSTIRGNPEFRAMLDEIRADMAAQLAHVREMDREGRLMTPL